MGVHEERDLGQALEPGLEGRAVGPLDLGLPFRVVRLKSTECRLPCKSS